MYNLINTQTGLVQFTGSYDDCLAMRRKLMKEEGAIMSLPENYYTLSKVK